MEKLFDIIGVVAWCFAVYVCAFDWSDARKPSGNTKSGTNGDTY